MSKGKTVVSVRVPVDVLNDLDEALARYWNAFAGPMTRADFVLKAIREKLAHMERSRRKRVRVPAGERWDLDDLAVPVGWPLGQ